LPGHIAGVYPAPVAISPVGLGKNTPSHRDGDIARLSVKEEVIVKEEAKDKEEGTMLSMKNHEDFKDSDEETLKKEDESCNGSRDENYDAKLRAKQPSTVFENEMKSTESVKHKDEISVDTIEEVADTTTKPVKLKKQTKSKPMKIR